MVFTPADGGEKTTYTVFDFKEGGGVGLGMYNTDEVIYLPFSLFFMRVF